MIRWELPSPGKINMEKNNSQQINFNKQIYSRTALEVAVLAFAELAKFTLRENDKYFLVEIDDIDVEVREIIAEEFANYVLVKMRK